MSDTFELPDQRVECPEGCLLSAGVGHAYSVPRYFLWASGGVGVRNYCDQCGERLVDSGTGDEVGEPEDFAGGGPGTSDPTGGDRV